MAVESSHASGSGSPNGRDGSHGRWLVAGHVWAATTRARSARRQRGALASWPREGALTTKVKMAVVAVVGP